MNRTRIAFKVAGKIWVNNHAHVLRPKAVVNIDYLSDFLESISLEPYITGTYQRKLNKGECERIPVPVPTSSVQDEIAAKIHSVHESEQMFRELAYQDPGNGRQQAACGTFDPGYLNYTLGKLVIQKLREE